jgi:hypothetical protein
MSLPGKMRSLKVPLTDEEFRSLHIATTLSPYATQSEFLASIILTASHEMIGQFRNPPRRLNE